MNKLPLKAALTAVAAAALLAGCSGGSDDDGGAGPGTTPPPTSSTDAVPASALESTDALVAYVRQLIGSTSETAEPLRIGDAKFPVSDTAEPAN